MTRACLLVSRRRERRALSSIKANLKSVRFELHWKPRIAGNSPSTALSSHLFDLASIPELTPPVTLPFFAISVPSSATTARRCRVQSGTINCRTALPGRQRPSDKSHNQVPCRGIQLKLAALLAQNNGPSLPTIQDTPSSLDKRMQIRYNLGQRRLSECWPSHH
jgi:hypothetical protein